MKYCPQCNAEYYDAVNVCGDCGRELIGSEEYAALAEKRARQDADVFVKVATVGDQFEADVIRDALEKEQIPVLIRSFQDTSFDGIFIPQKGWGIVEVPENAAPQARRIIEQLRQA